MFIHTGAWADENFKKLLLSDGNAAAKELGIDASNVSFFVYVCMYFCSNVGMYICMCVSFSVMLMRQRKSSVSIPVMYIFCLFTCLYVCLFDCMYVCMYVCMHAPS